MVIFKFLIPYHTYKNFRLTAFVTTTTQKLINSITGYSRNILALYQRDHTYFSCKKSNINAIFVSQDPANIQSKHQKHQAFEAELAANAERIQSVLAMGGNLVQRGQCSGSEDAVQASSVFAYFEFGNRHFQSPE